jgi:hypothetical protein
MVPGTNFVEIENLDQPDFLLQDNIDIQNHPPSFLDRLLGTRIPVLPSPVIIQEWTSTGITL